MSDAPQFQNYPKMMVHPHFRPAKLGTSPDDRKGTPGSAGSPIYMPPVTVHDERQEEYHASLGYVPGGNSNPAAFVAAHAAPEPDGPAGHQEYPKWVYDKEVYSEAEELGYRAEVAQREDAARVEAEKAAQMPVEGAAAEPALAGTVAALTASQAATNAKLDALIGVVSELAKRPAPAPSFPGLTRGQRAAATRRQNSGKARAEKEPETPKEAENV